MADAVATTTARSTESRFGISAAVVFGVGIVLGGFMIFAGNTDLKKGDNGGLGPAIFSAVLLLALAAVLYYAVLPRVQNVDRTVIVISAIAVVSLGVFWLGITPLLAAAAVAVAAKAPRLRTPAMVLQVLAVVAAVATVVISIAQSRVF